MILRLCLHEAGIGSDSDRNATNRNQAAALREMMSIRSYQQLITLKLTNQRVVGAAHWVSGACVAAPDTDPIDGRAVQSQQGSGVGERDAQEA